MIVKPSMIVKGQVKLGENINKSDTGTWLNASSRCGNQGEGNKGGEGKGTYQRSCKKKKKNDLLEAFNKCRDECNCQQKRCVALGLKVMFYV